MFMCNLNEEFHLHIRDIMGFSIGQLPVKYLGVPLIFSRLRYIDCMPLIEKLEKRLKSWKYKYLSYAGRLQLVIYVLSSMQVYWASMFIIPSAMTKTIEKLMRAFLWSGNELMDGKVKLA
ncbi:hypothetical protein Patl1_05611 [Pistacia atlantica]|uniref:Uncharacterized protein n=1 Tax=Pistacia atlantica TaxID=434234 RepID=A0ACC1BSZ4_9ROSI|nr:hypothetical protein Patl1_05611 [Pistacia atlantica]